MYLDGGRLVYAQYGESHDTALRASYKRWLVFIGNGTPSAKADVTFLDVGYVRYSEKFRSSRILLYLLATLKSTLTLSDNIELLTVLGRHYGKLPFLQKPRRWGLDCDFELWIKTARRLVFAGWHSVELFSFSSCKHFSLYALVRQRRSGYKHCRELKVFSPLVLAYAPHRTLAEANVHKVIWKIKPSGFSVFLFPSFLAFAREYPPVFRGGDPRIYERRDFEDLFLSPPCLLALVSGDKFSSLFGNSYLTSYDHFSTGSSLHE